MDKALLRQRAALWRARADQALERRDREACLEIAARYEEMAGLSVDRQPGLPPAPITD